MRTSLPPEKPILRKPPLTLPVRAYITSRFIFLITSLFIFLILAVSPSLAIEQTSNNRSGKGLSEYRNTIQKLQEGIIQEKRKIAKTRTTELNILAELEILDKKLASQQVKLEELETKMAKQQAMIDREEAALNKIRSEKNIVEAHLQKRITAYYTMGDIGLLNVTFSTKTLPELLRFHDAFDVLIKYDQDVIKVYRDTIDELMRVTTALALEKGVLMEFINQTKQETAILNKTREEKELLLTQVRTQEKLHLQAVAEMQQASNELANSIASIKSKRQKSPSTTYKRSFLSDKGNLPPPVDGIIVTLFQQEKTNKLGISRKSNGIELQADDGTKIVSVSEGEVLYSGYLRGYGNTVIIHHGYQYYTVTSRIEKLLVTKGQKVKKESNIGTMGDTATLFDEGLYFEIRHGKDSLDPLLWLDPNRLSNLHEQISEPAPAVQNVF